MVRKSFKWCGLVIGIFMSGCSGPGYETTDTIANSLLVDSAINTVNISLSNMDCGSAYLAIYPLYNSANSNNSIRSAMAATYGCYAKINALNVIGDMLNFSGDLGGPEFWSFLAQEFPSTANPDDKVPQAAEYGTDAIMAIVNPATILVPADTVNSTSNNPGSLLYTDRTTDANSYLLFMSMSLMGSLQNRYGSPSANYHKSTSLPWTTAPNTLGDGCAFASALLNYKDAITAVSTESSASIAAVYTKIGTFLSLSVDTACSAGCTLCGGSVSCTSCPFSLRDRASCTGLVTDVNSCAAAGIAIFVNSSWPGPP